ncbi:MAG: TolC family protein [Bacteroidales bacterium]|nr:TolC family protein [Bacteroidales bacterium]
MRRIWIILVLVFTNSIIKADDSISIQDCYAWVQQNYPLTAQKEYNMEAGDLKIRNILNNWYPQLSLKGQATYQSDVVKIAIDLPFPGVNFPTPSHDQYKLYFNINQSIYDGGTTKALKSLEEQKTLADVQQVEVNLYQLKKQINQVYFGILLFDKNVQILEMTLKELEQRRISVESGVKNGAILPTNLDVLDAEILKLQQQLDELTINRISFINILSELTGVKIDPQADLRIPDEILYSNDSPYRPEYTLFDIQKNILDAGYTVSKTSRLPRLYAFGEFGYGKPGLNVFNEEFDTYYVVGAGLSWNFLNWGKIQREFKIKELQKKAVDSNRENFDKNLNIALEFEDVKISQYQKAIEKDTKIIELRTRIRENAASRLSNGVITSTEYLSELNAELQAKILMEVHKISSLQANYNYQLLKGVQ